MDGLLETYLWLSAVFAGLTIAVVVYALTSKCAGMFSSKSNVKNVGKERNSLLISLLRPFASSIESSPRYEKDLAKYHRMLDMSGPFWGGMTPAEVVASRYIMPIFGSLWALVIGMAFKLPFLIIFVLILLASFIVSKLPESSLLSCVQKQKILFLRQLPGALDLLLISVKSGMDLRSSITYLASNYIDGPVKNELRRVERSVALGGSLSDSLMEMSDRMDLPILTSLIISLTQALETGTSIANILHMATGDIRKQQLVQAKTDAQTATVKIAFPLLLLIVPGMFIVLLGPVAIRMLTSVLNTF